MPARAWMKVPSIRNRFTGHSHRQVVHAQAASMIEMTGCIRAAIGHAFNVVEAYIYIYIYIYISSPVPLQEDEHNACGNSVYLVLINWSLLRCALDRLVLSTLFQYVV